MVKKKSKAVKLKPCPFCGFDPWTFKTDDGWFGIKCDSNRCLVASGVFVTLVNEKEAVSAWNTRRG